MYVFRDYVVYVERDLVKSIGQIISDKSGGLLRWARIGEGSG